MSKPSTTARGREGEDAVCVWLEKSGLVVLERNFRIRGGEVDIIAEGNGELRFVEVKRWQSHLVQDLALNIDRKRATRIREVASRWLRERRPSGFPIVHFDVALVDPADGSVEYLKGALDFI